MLLKEVMNAIEQVAPLYYQEEYDNSGLQVGNPMADIKGILLTLDVTEPIIDEAIERGCNLIVAHHPIIFKGLKRLSGANSIEKMVMKAIKHDINIYAAHTNLDNAPNGVNAMIAEKLGLQQTAILAPMQGVLYKLYTYVPASHTEQVRNALFAAGAGNIGKYTQCSYNTEGIGSFQPGDDSQPYIGTAGGPTQWEQETKIEVLVPKHLKSQVLQALHSSHPYEEVAYELIALQNTHQELGAGLVGTLAAPISETDFLPYVKERMKTKCIRHTALRGKEVLKVAVCGGSGSFLLPQAIAAGADFFITGDFKYHQFFDAEGKIVIADIGHYESEQFTSELLARVLNKKFPNFAILLSLLSTNPVNYFC